MSVCPPAQILATHQQYLVNGDVILNKFTCSGIQRFFLVHSAEKLNICRNSCHKHAKQETGQSYHPEEFP